MRCSVAVFSVALAVLPAYGVDRRHTIYVDRMSGFELLIEDALEQQEVWAKIIDLPLGMTLRISMSPRHQHRSTFVLFYSATGQRDDTTLELWDVRTKKTIASYHFMMPTDVGSQKRLVAEFVKQVRASLAPRSGT